MYETTIHQRSINTIHQRSINTTHPPINSLQVGSPPLFFLALSACVIDECLLTLYFIGSLLLILGAVVQLAQLNNDPIVNLITLNFDILFSSNSNYKLTIHTIISRNIYMLGNVTKTFFSFEILWYHYTPDVTLIIVVQLNVTRSLISQCISSH